MTRSVRFALAGLCILGVAGCAAERPAGPDPSAQEILLTLPRDTLTWIGDTVRLSASLRSEDGTEGPIAPEFSTTAPAILRVDATGLVTARSNGRGTISASAEGLKRDTSVVVAQRAAAVEVIGPDSVLEAHGLELRLSASALDRGGTPLDAGSSFTWSSSAPGVAKVDGTGRVTGLANGSTTITAEVDGARGTWPIRVAQVLAQEEVRGPVAFVGVTVLPMDGRGALEDHTVVTDGRTIVSVGPAAEVTPPAGAHVVDGSGRFLMPGLADMHTHVATETSIEAAPGQLLLYTAAGITTILNQGDFGEPLPGWAREVEDGTRLGPTIYTARYARGASDGNPTSVQVNGESGARAYAREAASLGYDFLKVYNHTGATEFAALVDEGSSVGLAVIGHVPQPVGFTAATDGGLVMLGHAGHGGLLTSLFGGGVRPDLVAVAVDQALATGTWINATLAVEEAFIRVWGGNTSAEQAVFQQEGVRYVHPATLERWRIKLFQQRLYNPAGSTPGQLDPLLSFMREYTGRLHGAGVPMLAGSDSPTVLLVPGFSLLRELELLEVSGLRREEVLEVATRNAGEFIDRYVADAEPFGTVASGQRADLLLLAADPRTSLTNLEQRLGVMTRGVWRTESWLRVRLEELAASYGR